MYSGITGSGAQYAPVVGAGVAAAQVGQQMYNTEGNTEDRAAASKTEALKAAMLAIPVYGQAAYLGLAGVDAVTGGKGTQAWTNFNKKLDKFNNKIDFGLQKSIDSKLFHQSTRGVQKEHTGQLLNQGEDDPKWQEYVSGMRAQNQEGPPDPTKPFAGKYASWEEYKNAGLEADNLTGVYGNLKTFGPEWASMSFDQQKAVTQGLIDNDLYYSKKGEVEISDPDKAQQIKDQVLGGSNMQMMKPRQLTPQQIQQGIASLPPQSQMPARNTAPAPVGGMLANSLSNGQQMPARNTMPAPMPTGANIDPGFMQQMPARNTGPAPALVQALAPRSKTRSPGIDKNGRRISY